MCNTSNMWYCIVIVYTIGLSTISGNKCELWGYSEIMSTISKGDSLDSKLAKFRILGGEDAEEGAWPWMVSIKLLYGDNTEFKHVCGGTLINAQWIVSAAHCFIDETDVQKYRVGLGQVNFDITAKKERIVSVIQLVIHHNYTQTGQAGRDIALIKLAEEVKPTEHIKPIILPKEKVEVTRENSDVCYVLGWGLTESREMSTHLQQLRLFIRNQSECVNMSSSLTRFFYNKDKLFCPGFYDEGVNEQGACQGDSGGPLLCRTSEEQYVRMCPSGTSVLRADHDTRCEKLPEDCRSGKIKCDDYQVDWTCRKVWRLVGIVSNGINCGGKPGVYVRVNRFKGWIRSILES